MSQKVCFICHEHISNRTNTATCRNLVCQSKYMIQHDEWKKNQMDYLYGVSYQPEEEE